MKLIAFNVVLCLCLAACRSGPVNPQDGSGDAPWPELLDHTGIPTFASSGGPVFNAISELGDIFGKVAAFDEAGHPRLLDLLDMFAGQAAISKWYTAAGKLSVAYDYATRGHLDDITCPGGFYTALYYVLQLKDGGLLCAGPPCCSWIWMSKSCHCREKMCAWGDCDVDGIRTQNTLVCNLIVLLIIAGCRHVHTMMEQPRSSVMLCFEPMKRWFDVVHAVRTSTYMRPYGHSIAKPTVLWGTWPLLMKLRRSWSATVEARYMKVSLAAARKGKFWKALQIKFRRCEWAPGKSVSASATFYTTGKWVTGTSHLSASAAYTSGFAKAVYDLHMEGQSCPEASDSMTPYTAYMELAAKVGLAGPLGDLATNLNLGLKRLKPEQLPVKIKKDCKAAERAATKLAKTTASSSSTGKKRAKTLLPGQQTLTFRTTTGASSSSEPISFDL